MNNILSLVKNSTNTLPKFGNVIAQNADGEIYELNEKAIKFGIVYNSDNPVSEYKSIEKVLFFLKDRNIPCFTKIFDSKFLGVKDGNLLFYYVMEKLKPITDDEQRVFHTLLSNRYNSYQLRKVLSEMRRGLDFDERKVTFFYETFASCPMSHSDAHARNLMKDSYGNFKFVNPERCVFKKGNY